MNFATHDARKKFQIFEIIWISDLGSLLKRAVFPVLLGPKLIQWVKFYSNKNWFFFFHENYGKERISISILIFVVVKNSGNELKQFFLEIKQQNQDETNGREKSIRNENRNLFRISLLHSILQITSIWLDGRHVSWNFPLISVCEARFQSSKEKLEKKLYKHFKTLTYFDFRPNGEFFLFRIREVFTIVSNMGSRDKYLWIDVSVR